MTKELKCVARDGAAPKILDTAVKIALKVGYRNVTREAIAARAGIATGTVSYHFKTMGHLRDAVVRYGVTHRILAIVAQGLAADHKLTRDIDANLKRAAAATLAA